MATSAGVEIPSRGKYLDRIKDQPLGELVAALRMGPGVNNRRPEQTWLEAQEKRVHHLPSSVSHAGASDRLLQHINGGTAVLCGAHKNLNGRAVHALAALIGDECGMHADVFREGRYWMGGHVPLIEEWLLRMGALAENFALAGEDVGGKLVVESGCEACICAMVGGHRNLTIDLLASLWSRKKIGGIPGLGEGTEGRPRLERPVLMWLLGGAAEQHRMVEMGVLAGELAMLIRQARDAIEAERQQQKFWQRTARLEEAAASPAPSGGVPQRRRTSPGSTNVPAGERNIHRGLSSHGTRTADTPKPLPRPPEIMITDYDDEVSVSVARSTPAKGKERILQPRAGEAPPLRRRRTQSFTSMTGSKITTVSGSTLHYLPEENQAGPSTVTPAPVLRHSSSSPTMMAPEPLRRYASSSSSTRIAPESVPRRSSSSSSTMVTSGPATTLRQQQRESKDSIQSFSEALGAARELRKGAKAHTWDAPGNKSAADFRAWFKMGAMESLRRT